MTKGPGRGAWLDAMPSMAVDYKYPWWPLRSGTVHGGIDLRDSVSAARIDLRMKKSSRCYPPVSGLLRDNAYIIENQRANREDAETFSKRRKKEGDA